jgi:hypothetical protein
MFQRAFKPIKEISDLWTALYRTRTEDLCRDSEYGGIYKHEQATTRTLWAKILLFNEITAITKVWLQPKNVQNGEMNFLRNGNRSAHCKRPMEGQAVLYVQGQDGSPKGLLHT